MLALKMCFVLICVYDVHLQNHTHTVMPAHGHTLTHRETVQAVCGTA